MKLFLSFSLADREWASEFADSLRDAGFEVLRWDAGVFNSGETIEESFRRSLESADILVPLLSERSVRNPNVMFELGFARGLRKAVVSVVVSREGEHPTIPTDLSGQFVIRADSPQQAAEQLKRYTAKRTTGT
jgi:nucleoside 2-deoxyribosyltransferase